ncbi:hypothetical protein [Legionella birminghamensis]|uniref:hypothetical protein n=1 Tax=Legionella birminghamensis TaxID=28083 RepID=UPI00104115FD|nr:hypothetical protein [Legionella birminghamensis]
MNQFSIVGRMAACFANKVILPTQVQKFAYNKVGAYQLNNKDGECNMPTISSETFKSIMEDKNIKSLRNVLQNLTDLKDLIDQYPEEKHELLNLLSSDLKTIGQLIKSENDIEDFADMVDFNMRDQLTNSSEERGNAFVQPEAKIIMSAELINADPEEMLEMFFQGPSDDNMRMLEYSLVQFTRHFPENIHINGENREVVLKKLKVLTHKLLNEYSDSNLADNLRDLHESIIKLEQPTSVFRGSAGHFKAASGTKTYQVAKDKQTPDSPKI